jgi:TPR repeat protein
MLSLLFLLATWHSNAPWKSGLTMKDPFYLPAPPMFALVQPLSYPGQILADLLSVEYSTSDSDDQFLPSAILNDLNSRADPDKSMSDLLRFCRDRASPQACLILGRIYEFGAYNQTENHTKAREYYERVASLNDTSSLSALSFMHRHSGDVPLSMVEADASLASVESALPAALQSERGFIRPLSCPEAARLLVPIATAVAEMTFFPLSPVDPSDVVRLMDSSDPADLHRLAMYDLSRPYPSMTAAETAKDRLERALSAGHQESAAPLATLYSYLLPGPINISRILDILRPAVILDDPAALLVSSELYLIPELTWMFNPQRALKEIEAAAGSGYAPALHRMAEIRYWGLLGVGKNSTHGFKLFSKAAAAGHRPSIVTAALMLLSGDGVVADCPAAIEMLKRVVDTGPWFTYLDKYLQAGSTHAFVKMVDMHLTPGSWTDIDAPSEVTAELIREMGHVPKAALRKARAAREGNESALLWMTLNSPLDEALEWLANVEMLPPDISMLSKPLRWFLIARALCQKLKGRLSEKEDLVLHEMLKPLYEIGLFLAAALCLMLLIILRIHITLT